MRLTNNILSIIVLFGFLVFFSCEKQEIVKLEEPKTEEVTKQEENGSGGPCQCVGYVKKQLSINTSTANAKD